MSDPENDDKNDVFIDPCDSNENVYIVGCYIFVGEAKNKITTILGEEVPDSFDVVLDIADIRASGVLNYCLGGAKSVKKGNCPKVDSTEPAHVYRGVSKTILRRDVRSLVLLLPVEEQRAQSILNLSKTHPPNQHLTLRLA